MIYIMFSLFVIYAVYNEWTRYKNKKEVIRVMAESEKRFNEIEKYAYTDIRQLNDILKEVKKRYVKEK